MPIARPSRVGPYSAGVRTARVLLQDTPQLAWAPGARSIAQSRGAGIEQDDCVAAQRETEV